MPLSDACNRRLFSTWTFFFSLLYYYFPTLIGCCLFLTSPSRFIIYILTRDSRNGLSSPACRFVFILCTPKTLFATRRQRRVLRCEFVCEYFETVYFHGSTAVVCKERINCQHFLYGPPPPSSSQCIRIHVYTYVVRIYLYMYTLVYNTAFVSI